MSYSDFELELQSLPKEIQEFYQNKLSTEGASWLALKIDEIVKEYNQEKNKSDADKIKERKIKAIENLKEDLIKNGNDFIFARGLSSEDVELEIDLRIKNPELNKQANPISDQRNKQIQIPASLLSGTYELETNFDEKIEDLIDTSRFDYKNGDINSQNFKTERKGRIKQVAYLIHFNKDISSDDAVEELDKLGLRPAELHELLEFSIKYPDIQRQFPIVALVSTLRRWRDRVFAPYLYSDASGRHLHLPLWSSRWSGRCRFLALSK